MHHTPKYISPNWKLQEESMGENLYNLGIVQDFLHKNTECKPYKENTDNGTFFFFRTDFLNEVAQGFCMILAAILMRSNQPMLYSVWKQCNKIFKCFQSQQINCITPFQKYTVKMSYDLVTNESSLHFQLILLLTLDSPFYFLTVWRHGI